METELNKKNDKFKYLKITTVICLIAVVLSFAGCGASANGGSSSGKSYASLCLQYPGALRHYGQ